MDGYDYNIIVFLCRCGGMADAADSKSAVGNYMWVQVPPTALILKFLGLWCNWQHKRPQPVWCGFKSYGACIGDYIMGMRRLFIIRKDLNLSSGKLAAMVGHCAEAYWTNFINKYTIKCVDNTLPCIDLSLFRKNVRRLQPYKRSDLYELSKKAFDEGKDYFLYDKDENGIFVESNTPKYRYVIDTEINNEIYEGYINNSFVKTICEAKNLNHLLKVVDKATELKLYEDRDYGFINDKCLTELTPENEDGTCTVGIWFRPLDDDIAHELSKKYQLYKG